MLVLQYISIVDSNNRLSDAITGESITVRGMSGLLCLGQLDIPLRNLDHLFHPPAHLGCDVSLVQTQIAA